LLIQAVADQHVRAAGSLEQLLAAVWREIVRWKDSEKRSIAAQVAVDPATLDSLDKMYVLTDYARIPVRQDKGLEWMA